MAKSVYVVQYHDNSWGAQMSFDDILGVYDSEEAAMKRAEEFESKWAFDDDGISVYEYDINEDALTMMEIEMGEPT